MARIRPDTVPGEPRKEASAVDLDELTDVVHDASTDFRLERA